ncbi:homeobox-leucine zipper protein HOX32-like [Telopea speciosissima]|uniref:homeobox-leucine zipper protein HOX32-like n=1 Tax=Telopea speciosissima TaxID=54955 RepID=UPI001CC813DB|nr:homeobox-leucine zipper protein HOX32-like [Telopea speciosissima]
MALSIKESKQMDSSKCVRYTPEQVEALERVCSERPNPSSMRRCREKQRKDASCVQTANRKLTAMNKLLMEENDRLQKQVSHLMYENGFMRQQLQNLVKWNL